MNAADLVDFLQELRANNNKAWFDSNRARYDALRADFLADVTAIVEGVAAFDDKLGDISPSASLFRINRDVRFSKVKAPYKTTFSAMLVPGKKSAHGQPGYYFHIDADDELMAAAGAYMPDTATLAKMRRAIANDPAGFDAIVSKSVGDVFPQLGGEKLKSTPKEYGAEHAAAEYLKHKGYILFSSVEASSLSGSAVVDHVLYRFHTAAPLVQFLRDTISG